MKIEIEIPKEFEEHFKQDKFKDSLERIMADMCEHDSPTVDMCIDCFYDAIQKSLEQLKGQKK